MRAIEYAWNMRKGTLNLDTRRNVFFRKSLHAETNLKLDQTKYYCYAVGSSMRDLYESGKWALLPPEEVVDKYLSKPRGRYNRGNPLDREDFPQKNPTAHESITKLGVLENSFD